MESVQRQLSQKESITSPESEKDSGEQNAVGRPPRVLSLAADDLLCCGVFLEKESLQIGLVDRPQGETRAARYGSKHLEQLLLIKKWTAAGVSLERIRELLHGAPPPVPPPSFRVCPG